jgi:iron(III) transport system ATP-binding protein
MSKASGGVVFDRVSKRYGKLTVVDEVSFTVSPGELVTLLGPSGCGKTTTLRMVAGLEPVTSGRIAIGGTDVTLRAANERDVSMVFQSYALFPHMTVLENVCYGPLSTSSDKVAARKLAHAKLEMLGWPGSAIACRRSSPAASSSASRWRARSCSSQRCCCSTSRCRISTRSCAGACGRRSATCSSRSSSPVIYVTHDQEEALAVSDQIIVMESGRIAQKGTPHELYESPASRFLADFIGDANLVDGELLAGDGGRSFSAGGAGMPVTADGIAPGPATLAVRPNRLRLAHPDRAPCRACASAPPTSAAASSTWWTPRGASSSCSTTRRASRAHATTRSAWRSTRTPRSCCAARTRPKNCAAFLDALEGRQPNEPRKSVLPISIPLCRRIAYAAVRWK